MQDFFFGGGKFGARLRTYNFFFCLVVPTFQSYNNYSFQLVYFQHYLDKPHHLIQVEVSQLKLQKSYKAI